VDVGAMTLLADSLPRKVYGTKYVIHPDESWKPLQKEEIPPEQDKSLPPTSENHHQTILSPITAQDS
jgi:hypothetical protein